MELSEHLKVHLLISGAAGDQHSAHPSVCSKYLFVCSFNSMNVWCHVELDNYQIKTQCWTILGVGWELQLKACPLSTLTTVFKKNVLFQCCLCLAASPLQIVIT